MDNIQKQVTPQNKKEIQQKIEVKSSNKPQQQFSLYNQLFEFEKPSSNDEVKNKQSVPSDKNKKQHSLSQITKYLLKKLKQNEKQMWKLLDNVPQLIQQIIQYINQNNQQNPYKKLSTLPQNQTHYIQQGSIHYKNKQTIYIGKGTVIQHGTLITGPCLIGNNCEIRKGAFFRGIAILGDGIVLGNSSQLKNTILMDQCQVPHFNYVGDSIVGVHGHFAAGSIVSNFKLDGSLVKVNFNPNHSNQNNNQKTNITVTTGRRKLGAIIGHNVEIGCNAILNPGSIIGKNSIIYPATNWRGFLPANRICKLLQEQSIIVKRQNK